MTILKPCPFCGSKAEIGSTRFMVSGRTKGGRAVYAYCINPECFAQSRKFDWDELDELVKTWNRRAE